jgi:hypothetical protein
VRFIVIFLILLNILFLAGCSSTSVETSTASSITGEKTYPTITETKTTQKPTETEKAVNCFIVIHNEPGRDAKSTAYAKQYWPALVQLVASADDEGHKLTLLFNPQWATYIMEDSTRLTMLRSWEANGHEIGLHHHGPHMAEWDGYTDQEEFFNHPEFIGTINDMMELMKKLPASGIIRTAGIPDTDAVFEYPAGILYDVDGGSNGINDLVSCPSRITWNNHVMTHLTHAKYAESAVVINVSLQEIEQAINNLSKDEVIGIVFHSFEYADNPEVFKTLFAFLSSHDVYARTVTDILQ